MTAKAAATDFHGRFREIVSDPLNLLIRRHPEAGQVIGSDVVLHNGILVPWRGEHAYYDTFSDILVINRGVHEPLEEYAFQQLLGRIGARPVMLELGAYWAHYSMWCKSVHSDAITYLVEPDADNLAVGRRNFARNGFEGTFEQQAVGRGAFTVDEFMQRNGVERLTILHADIQGAEVEMIEGAARTLGEGRADYVLISTHSQQLHADTRSGLEGFGYRIDADADFDSETTSFDGFLLAVRPDLGPPLLPVRPFSREEIPLLQPLDLLARLQQGVREV